MSRTLKKGLITLLILLVVTTGVLIGINLNAPKRVTAEVSVTLSEDLKTQYILGDQITVPTATLDYEGGVQADKFKVVTPSGLAHNKSSFKIDEAGQYSIYYYKTVANGQIQGVKSFTVKNSAFSVSGSSTLTYGTNQKTGADLAGLNVTLKSGEVFNCNIPINLTGKKASDILVNIVPLPDVVGELEEEIVYDDNGKASTVWNLIKKGNQQVGDLFVRLTDAYNPDNYITIKTTHADLQYAQLGGMRFGRSYQKAAIKDGGYNGLRIVSTSNLPYEGFYYYLESGNAGYMSFASLTAANGYNEKNGNCFFSIDYKSRKVYGSIQGNSTGDNLILDLDEEMFVGTNVWEGFTTGECYLSVYAEGYTGNQFEFMITDIYDIDLTQTEKDDTVKPTIEIDKPQGAYGVVGTPFNIFPATALDVVSGTLTPEVYVLYNGSVGVAVENGKFLPEKAGRYTIIYKVTDAFGNSAEAFAYVQAYEQSNVALDFGLIPTGMKTGMEITLEKPTVTNASGSYSLAVKAVLKSDSSVSYDLANGENGLTFRPLYAGEYDIIYQVTDYACTTQKTKTITVQAGQFAMATDPVLPEYFIKDATYAIPAGDCYKLDSGAPQAFPSEVYYAFDGEAPVKLNGDLKVQASNSVGIYYYNGNVQIAGYQIPVVNANYADMYNMDISNYLVIDKGFALDEADRALNYAAYTFTENGQMQYAKKLMVSNFRFSFSVPQAGFIALNLALRSGDQLLDIVVRPLSEEKMVIAINGGVEFTVNDSYLDNARYELRYNNANKTVSVYFAGQTTTCMIPQEVFAGFADNEAYLEVKTLGTSAKSKLIVYSINNQTISSTATDDSYAPEIYHQINAGARKLNERIEIKEIKALDMLSVYTSCVVTVKAPDRKVVTDDNGVALNKVAASGEYAFTLTQYGTYQIEILAEDLNGNRNLTKLTVNVQDYVAPVIQMDTATKIVAVGSTVSLPSYTITDNVDKVEDIKIRAMYINPNGIAFDFEKDFVASVKGDYLVMVYAMDTYGNLAQAHFTVTVR